MSTYKKDKKKAAKEADKKKESMLKSIPGPNIPGPKMGNLSNGSGRDFSVKLSTSSNAIGRFRYIASRAER
jgi:hypothetical protein